MFTRILFESPLLLVLAWFPVQVALLVYWSRTRTPRSGRVVWGGLASLLFVLILQAFVATDRERLLLVCQDIAAAAERGSAPGVMQHVSRSFRTETYDYDGFEALVERAFQHTTVERIRFRNFTAHATDDGRMVAEFDASSNIRRGDFSGMAATGWRVTFEPDGDTWKIVTVEALPRPMSPLHDLADIGR